MSIKQKKVFWRCLFGMIALATTAFVLVQAGARRPSNSSSPAQNSRPTRSATRNLSGQPEAFKMSRQLGRRFANGKRVQSTLIGTLTISGERKILRIVRKQTSEGEDIEVNVAGSGLSLTWDATQGPLTSGTRASGSERDLIERLVLDSPDQFVLAQLRGASYYTIARNVRPEGATDNYNGPLWNIVRVDDPEKDITKRAQSAWRLYYINTLTGLLDKVVYEAQGQPVVAEFSRWTNLNGENIPGETNWTRQGQTIMQYRLTNFSYADVR